MRLQLRPQPVVLVRVADERLQRPVDRLPCIGGTSGAFDVDAVEHRLDRQHQDLAAGHVRHLPDAFRLEDDHVLVADHHIRVAGHRDHRLGLELVAGVDAVELVADHGEQPPAAGCRAVDADADSALDRIADDQRAMALEAQDHAAAPAALVGAQHVGADDEPRQQALRQQRRVVVLEAQAALRVERFRLLRLLLGQQLRDQVALVVVGEAEAELELAHQLQQEGVPFLRVARRIEDRGHVADAQLALAARRRVRVIQDLVDAFGDPARVQHVQVMEAGVVAVVERHPQPVQDLGELVLLLVALHAGLGAQRAVPVEGKVVLRHRGQSVLDREPGRREGVAQARQGVDLAMDRVEQRLPALGRVGAVGGDDVADHREFLPQRRLVHGEWVLPDLVEHDDHRRLAAEARDQVEPVLGVGVLAPLPPVEDDEVQAAVGQEELVGRMHDLLAAEIPDMDPHLGILQWNGPVGNGDAVGHRLARIETIVDQPLDQ